jgi:hypothetical protein
MNKAEALQTIVSLEQIGFEYVTYKPHYPKSVPIEEAKEEISEMTDKQWKNNMIYIWTPNLPHR